jgi:hypothetical protein
MANRTINLSDRQYQLLIELASQHQPKLSKSAMVANLIEREARSNPATAQLYTELYPEKAKPQVVTGKRGAASQLEIE